MPNVYVLAALSDSHEKNAFFAFPSWNAILIKYVSLQKNTNSTWKDCFDYNNNWKSRQGILKNVMEIKYIPDH